MVSRRDMVRGMVGAGVLGSLAPASLHAAIARARATPPERGLGFFDAHQLQTVASAADRILPETATPGARDVGCHRFIELIVSEHYPAARQKRFVDGLVALDVRTSRAVQHLFVDAADAEQDAMLTAVEAEAMALPQGTGSFWRDLKELTLVGFYTSRVGIEDELQVNAFPGAFDGCAPMEGA